MVSSVTEVETQRARRTVLPLYENCEPLTVLTGRDSHRILINLGSQKPWERCWQRGALGPLSLPKDPGFWSKKLYFSSLLRALRQALHNTSPHFITQQACLSFNLICIEQLEVGYKAAKPRMKMQCIFWLQESLIQSLETGAKNRHQFHLYPPPPTSHFSQVQMTLQPNGRH